MKSTKLLSALKWIKKETIHIIPAVIYFLIAFNLIYFTGGLMLEPGHTRYFTPLAVTLGALIIGKVIILVNAFSFINMFPQNPLIYNIVWKFFIYMFFVFSLWTIETIAKLTDKYENFSLIFQHFKAELLSPVFLATLSWLALTFLIFVVASEFIRVIGKEKIVHLLLDYNLKG